MKWMCAVDAAGGDDLALAGDRLGARADDDVDARLDVGIAGLADADDAAVPEADVGLHDAPMVEDQRVGDDGVDGALRARALALAHAVADHLAAAELHLLAVDRVVLLDLDEELGVGQPHPVADGRAEHVGIGGARDARRALVRRPDLGDRPQLARDPGLEAVDSRGCRDRASSRTVRVWPGSKRTAVPAAMSSRMPCALVASNFSASLVSKKW